MPAVYGSEKTLSDKIVRWTEKVVRLSVFKAIAPSVGLPAEARSADTHAKSHRCAARGQAADCRAAEALLGALPAGSLVHADKACDTKAIRSGIEARGAVL